MQLNITLDEELHKKLQDLSKKRGTSLPEMTRSVLRALAPEQESIKATIYKDGAKTSNFHILGSGVIHQFPLDNHSHWCGTVEVSLETLDKFGKNFSEIYNTKIIVTTENGRQGGAMITGMHSKTKDTMIVVFTGTSTLS